MKALYRAVFAFCLFVLFLGLLVSFGTPPEESLVREMLEHPDRWTLETTKPALSLLRDPVEARALLSKFLRNHGRPTDEALRHLAQLLVVVALFSGLGWYREMSWERRSESAIASDK